MKFCDAKSSGRVILTPLRRASDCMLHCPRDQRPNIIPAVTIVLIAVMLKCILFNFYIFLSWVPFWGKNSLIWPDVAQFMFL